MALRITSAPDAFTSIKAIERFDVRLICAEQDPNLRTQLRIDMQRTKAEFRAAKYINRTY